LSQISARMLQSTGALKPALVTAAAIAVHAVVADPSSSRQEPLTRVLPDARSDQLGRRVEGRSRSRRSTEHAPTLPVGRRVHARALAARAARACRTYQYGIAVLHVTTAVGGPEQLGRPRDRIDMVRIHSGITTFAGPARVVVSGANIKRDMDRCVGHDQFHAALPDRREVRAGEDEGHGSRASAELPKSPLTYIAPAPMIATFHACILI